MGSIVQDKMRHHTVTAALTVQKNLNFVAAIRQRNVVRIIMTMPITVTTSVTIMEVMIMEVMIMEVTIMEVTIMEVTIMEVTIMDVTIIEVMIMEVTIMEVMIMEIMAIEMIMITTNFNAHVLILLLYFLCRCFVGKLGLYKH